MDHYRVYANVGEMEPDEASAFAQGVANNLGMKVSLIRLDHGDEVNCGDFKPVKK